MKKILAALAAAFLAAQAASAADSIVTVNLFHDDNTSEPYDSLVVTNALGARCSVILPNAFPDFPVRILGIRHEDLPFDCTLKRVYGLCVGVGQSGYGQKPLAGAPNDAAGMAGVVKTAYSCLAPSVRTLVDDAATKEAIRQGFAEAGNYFKESGLPYEQCLFVFSISTHGGGRPAFMCAYDQDYLATELAEDLASLPAGVTSICIVDTCHAGSMDPFQLPNAVLDAMAERGARNGLSYGEARQNALSQVLFLGACGTEEKANDTKFLGRAGSAFTTALCRAVNGNADADGDLDLDWGELFRDAWRLVVSEEKKQSPYCSSFELAASLFAGRVQDWSFLPILALEIYQGEERWFLRVPTLSYEHLIIDVATGSCYDYPVSLDKFSSTTKTDKDGSVSSKGSFAISVPLEAYKAGYTARGLAIINGQYLPCGELRGGKPDKGQLTYGESADDGKLVSIVKVKANPKKGFVTIKGNFVQPPGYPQIADALMQFLPNSICMAGDQGTSAPVVLMTRMGGRIVTDPWRNVDIKDNGKTFKAKLSKKVLM